MIKGNELRLGNLVYYNGNHNEIGKITEIGVDSLSVNSYVRIDFRVNKRFTDIEPIKLTEEILLKCGFTKELDNFYRFNKSTMIEVCLYDNGILVTTQSVYLSNIIALHQLQNLYWCLCGKELTFNN